MPEIGIGTVLLGGLAGILSTLSPCVLPILPLLFAGALGAHRYGIVVLSAGLVLSFVTFGMFVATIGFSIGLDGDILRPMMAVPLALIGFVLLSARLQARFAMASSGFGDAGHRVLARFAPSGLSGQFTIGVALGAIWSPCVGPTLGAASLLASQGKNLMSVTVVMLAFGIGAAIPLTALGMLSRSALTRWRGTLLRIGQSGRRGFGLATLAVAALILTGSDRTLEAALVRMLPDWMTRLTTAF